MRSRNKPISAPNRHQTKQNVDLPLPNHHQARERMSSSNASHNRINLGRILARLEKIVLVEDGNRGGTGGGLKDKSWWEVRRLSEVRLVHASLVQPTYRVC
jgi:hypothetical protein